MYSDHYLRIYLSHEHRLAQGLERRRLAQERKAALASRKATTTPAQHASGDQLGFVALPSSQRVSDSSR